jgi:hypothetical protein
MNKHFIQIRAGGLKVIAKKLRAFFYLLLQMPIYLISIPFIIILCLITFIIILCLIKLT